jgi:hypothetical protein
MSRATLARVAIPVVGVALAAAFVIPAVAAQNQAPNRATIKTVGAETIKPNRFLKIGLRFNRDLTAIRRGGMLTIADRTGEPHTLSLVRRGQLPLNFRQMEACFGKGPCDELAVDHGAINPETGEEQDPTTPLVNKGAAGFNQLGDSVLLEPRRRTKVKITAARGKNLYFLCAIHPWMQGKLAVR